MNKHLNLTAFVLMVAVNALAAFGILGGIRTQDVSALFPSLLTPAGMTFSIWSVIYLALAGLIVWQMFDNKVGDFREAFSGPFITSCVLNILWMVFWQSKLIGWSVITMIFLLSSLLYLLSGLSRYDSLIKAPVALYTGWVNIAFYANLSAWIGIENKAFAIILLAVAILQIAFMDIKFRNFFYGLAAAWGVLGIAVANKATNKEIFQFAAVMTIILVIKSVISPFMDKRRKCGICR